MTRTVRTAAARLAALALAAAGLLAGTAARAETVALLPATGANVEAEHLAAATDILRAYLERSQRFTVVRVPPAPGEEPTPAQAGEAATAVGAHLAVTLRISRLGTNALARIAAYRQDGVAVHRDELGAGSVDDLDSVLSRLADGLAKARPAAELAELDTVTEREARPRLKKATDSLFGLRIQAVEALQRADPDRRAGLSSGLALLWQYDSGAFLADVDLGFALSNLDRGATRDRVGGLGMGIYLPFAKTDMTPYAGGGLAFEWSRFGGDGASGLVARAGGGLLVGRLTRVVVRVDANVFYDLYAEREPGTGKENHAWGVGFSVAVLGSAR
jgi:hypothetical protein